MAILPGYFRYKDYIADKDGNYKQISRETFADSVTLDEEENTLSDFISSAISDTAIDDLFTT